MSEHFPSLPEATLAAANQLGAWLAQHDLPQQPSIDVAPRRTFWPILPTGSGLFLANTLSWKTAPPTVEKMRVLPGKCWNREVLRTERAW